MHKIKKKTKPLSIKEFVERRNKVLIHRKTGGLGDILMHRLIFEDFKLLRPEMEVHFACPKQFMQAVQDHPFIDKVLDYEEVDPSDYLQYYNTTVICGRTEMMNAPMPSDHRSDIWAGWCGLPLTRHNMHLKFTEDELAIAEETVKKVRDRSGPSVAFSPCSAIKSKNLDEQQIREVVDGLHKLGCFVYGLHTFPILGLETPLLAGKTIRNYMALVAVADYAVSVDSAAFHIAGGLGKPQVGIFSWADGKVYGKYYKNWVLVQRHRDNGNWDCGPCYNWGVCPKQEQVGSKFMRKPCITEITGAEIVKAFTEQVYR